MALDILNVDSSAAIHNLFPPVLSEADIAFADKPAAGANVRHTPTQGEDLSARDRMVLDHLHLVKATASSIRKSLPVHADYDDLVQAGIVGLIDAANKYDSEKPNSFPTYAKHRIRGAILDNLRKLDWASRDMRRRQKLVAAAMAELTAILQRTPSEARLRKSSAWT